MTWLCFLAAFAGFYAVFWFLEHYIGTERVSPMRFNAFGNYEQSVFSVPVADGSIRWLFPD